MHFQHNANESMQAASGAQIKRIDKSVAPEENLPKKSKFQKKKAAEA